MRVDGADTLADCGTTALQSLSSETALGNPSDD